MKSAFIVKFKFVLKMHSLTINAAFAKLIVPNKAYDTGRKMPKKVWMVEVLLVPY